ncbi:hypothetical protein DFH01_20205 [Falsiroseomonas bella]|uniref:Uncharacterized protein n=1 Tax=Falsiroseomonas bella TaxID=2184016 RepID=A0A317FBR7_9PROT|nr:hypothetical protein [Falsiroseomonas bella]PWS35892.1 hypothetical protein DFH01_20205 [Falsiroseomonas bella]
MHAHLLAETLVERIQGGGGEGGRTGIWMIYVAVAVDLTSDGLMLGTGAAVSAGLGLVLAAGQVLADLPEGYAAVPSPGVAGRVNSSSSCVVGA